MVPLWAARPPFSDRAIEEVYVRPPSPAELLLAVGLPLIAESPTALTALWSAAVPLVARGTKAIRGSDDVHTPNWDGAAAGFPTSLMLRSTRLPAPTAMGVENQSNWSVPSGPLCRSR